MFSSASSSVVPCDQQPGRPGQETLNPSSDSLRTTLYFMLNLRRDYSWRLDSRIAIPTLMRLSRSPTQPRKMGEARSWRVRPKRMLDGGLCMSALRAFANDVGTNDLKK